MMRSTHSISVRLCIPARVSSRINAGRPITRANNRATLKYSPYSSSSIDGYRCNAVGSPASIASCSTCGGHARGLVRVVDALAVERVDAAGGIADDEVRRTGLRAHRAAHRDAPAGGLALGLVGVDLPTIGDLMGIGVEQMSGVDALELAERRQQSDADVDRAVADREDPSVAGHRVAVAILHVERRLDPRLGVTRRSPSRCGWPCRTATPACGTCRASDRSDCWPRRRRRRIGRGSRWARRRAVARRRRARSRDRRSAAAPRDLRAAWLQQRPRCEQPSCRARGGARRIRAADRPDAMAIAVRAGDPCRSRATRCIDGTGRADRRGPSRSAGARRAVSGRRRTSSRGGTTCARRS